MAKDYYTTLGVGRNASDKEVRSAYRRLARKLHPDVNPGDKAAESRFKEVNEAYEVLSDPDKRKKYDLYGENWQHADQFEAARRGRTRTQYYGAAPAFEFSEFDFGDSEGIFGSIFGRRGRGRPRSLNVEQRVDVTLEEAYQGTTRTLQMAGEGGQPRRIEVKIPAGVASGSRVRVAGEGMAMDGMRGDLYLAVEVLPHDRFERRGDDLQTDIEVPLTTAVLGGEIEVQAIGRKVALKIPPMSQNGRVIRLAGLGMPRLNQATKGDLYARVSVKLPEQLGPEERQAFEKLRERGI
jgi:DnaJ-class molecular chaperone